MAERSLRDRLPQIGLAHIGIDHPRSVTAGFALVCVALATLALLPTLWPHTFSLLHPAAIDTDPDGPLTDSGYRSLDAALTQVDVRGPSVVIDFDVIDENGAVVDDLLASDGRFTIVRLDAGVDGDPSQWVGIGDSSNERFTSGVFENLMGGAYRYTSLYDPTGRVAMGDPIRVAIQLSASDLPAENAWCDFDADLAVPNDCVSGTTLTRDIVQTLDCNGCHGTTSDTHLSFHGGGRTDVEYCVTCHNPNGNTDMTLLIHKVHAVHPFHRKESDQPQQRRPAIP